MPLKYIGENRNFTEWTIKFKKSQTESKGDKPAYEDKRKWKTSNKGIKPPAEYGYPTAVIYKEGPI